MNGNFSKSDLCYIYDCYGTNTVEDNFTTLSMDAVVLDRVAAVADLEKILGVRYFQARLLLRKFEWNKTAILNSFYYYSLSCSEFLRINQISLIRPFYRHHAYKNSLICDICSRVVPSAELVGVGCEHAYCENCWVAYLKIELRGGKFDVYCPGKGCAMLVDEGTVMHLVCDAKLRDQYHAAAIEEFIRCNKQLRLCVGKGCNKVMKLASEKENRRISCKCGAEFCFDCGEDCHEPVSCELLKKWNIQVPGEYQSETVNWLIRNTKECPTCLVLLKKEGGCNDVQCPKCHHDFCWNCLRAHSDVCEGYDDEYSDDRDSESSDADGIICMHDKTSPTEMEVQLEHRIKVDSKRYLEYLQVYLIHKTLLEKEYKTYKRTKFSVKEAENSIQVMRMSVDTLLNCRRALMNSFIFAYFYIKKGHPEQRTFKYNQEKLREGIENLLLLLKRENTEKGNLQYIANDCAVRCRVLVNHVREGYKKGCWKIDQDNGDPSRKRGKPPFSRIATATSAVWIPASSFLRETPVVALTG